MKIIQSFFKHLHAYILSGAGIFSKDSSMQHRKYSKHISKYAQSNFCYDKLFISHTFQFENTSVVR